MQIERIEASLKWIRGTAGKRTVVDTKNAQLVWEHEYYPYWYIPVADVHDPSLPTTTIDELPGHVKVDWSSVEHWFEEDEEVIIHPRDPYRRIDAQPSSRHITVEIDDTIIANSTRPTILYETGLQPRYYLPRGDIRMDLLTPTQTSTGCPYKGYAHYWTATVDGTAYPDIAWGYDAPLPESAPVKGLVCFYNEKVTISVD